MNDLEKRKKELDEWFKYIKNMEDSKCLVPSFFLSLQDDMLNEYEEICKKLEGEDNGRI